jgi:hypothetical protein
MCRTECSVPTVITIWYDIKNSWYLEHGYLEFSGYLEQLFSPKHYIYMVYIELLPIFRSADHECCPSHWFPRQVYWLEAMSLYWGVNCHCKPSNQIKSNNFFLFKVGITCNKITLALKSYLPSFSSQDKGVQSADQLNSPRATCMHL